MRGQAEIILVKEQSDSAILNYLKKNMFQISILDLMSAQAQNIYRSLFPLLILTALANTFHTLIINPAMRQKMACTRHRIVPDNLIFGRN